MATWDWEFDDNHAQVDAEIITSMFGEKHGVLDIPDHSQPFILGKHQFYPEPPPRWISDLTEHYDIADMPSDRVLFQKMLNTRLPEDIQPRDYDQLVFEMELMVRNSPYRPSVYTKKYSSDPQFALQRPDLISSFINEKTGAVVSVFYNFFTEYLPQVPIRALVWTFEQTPKAIEKAKFTYAKVTAPHVPPQRPPNAWDIVKNLDLSDKTVVVTGSSSGIGKEVARSFASRGARVLLPARDVVACDKMAMEWRNEFGNSGIHCSECNMSSMSSVFGFLHELKLMNVVPDYLVNCAATLKPLLSESHSGQANIAMGVNLLSHMTLTDGILEMMEKEAAAPVVVPEPDLLERAILKFMPNLAKPKLMPVKRVRRIVNLTCSEYKDAAIRGEELTAEGLGALTGVRAYNASKLGLIAHAQHVALWLERSGKAENIAINSLDPGFTYGTKLYQNTFFKRLRSEILSRLSLESSQSAEVAAGSVLSLLLDESTANNGLHYTGLTVSESPLIFKQSSWRTKFLNAIEDLRDKATKENLKNVAHSRELVADRMTANGLKHKIKQMNEWYMRQSEDFERSLELPMPEMMPMGQIGLRPPPPQEIIGSKPLGIGPPEAPLIGEDLLANWQHIGDTLPVQISEMERRTKLAPPDPSPEEQAAIDKTKAEFEALKAQIMYERQVKSHVTSQYADPLPAHLGQTWWSWIKAKVNDLTRPTINR